MDCWSVYGIGAYSHPNEEWVRLVLEVSLSDELPDEILEMFDRARATMVYGCFYYPLFTNGMEEIYRIKEAALKEACREGNASRATIGKGYKSLIDWAHSQGFIADDDLVRWHAGRSLRNAVSHKDKAMLLGPNDALRTLDISKELIEKLFCAVRGKRQPTDASV
ncbi:hypothetical protein DX908_02640 [Parvularcula marina]|uniref:DUF4145 domain-containing protein n=2 Tax=Parvularcula marina TaxID=2292771 RepID=A0A371RFR1_9PROT|nr:hypothetical protein DX908_02640 [Parvularcula marina]